MDKITKSVIVGMLAMSQIPLLALADTVNSEKNAQQVGVEPTMASDAVIKDKQEENLLTKETNEENKDVIVEKENEENTASQEDISQKTSDALEKVVEPEVVKKEVSQTFKAKTVSDEEVAQDTGDGTKDSPYLVSNAEELKNHFEEGKSAEQTIYITLLNDIIYTDKNFMTAHSSIVIDGDNHSILYDGTKYTEEHFKVNQPNATITLKNINYGNSRYPNSTNRGIMLPTNENITLKVENVTYNILNGAQPFYSTGNNTVLNFYGENMFNQNINGASVHNDEEFIEGFSTINYKENSHTEVNINTKNSESVFYPKSTFEMTIENQAKLEMNTSKPVLVYGGADDKNQINIADNAEFQVSFSGSTARITNKRKLNFSMFDNSTLRILNLGTASGINMKTTVINNKQSPKLISLESKNTNRVISGGKVELQNIDNQLYQLLSETNNSWENIPFTGNNFTLPNNGAKAFVYKKRMTLDGVKTEATLLPDVSSIHASLEGIPEHMETSPKYFADYYISEKTYSEDGVINQEEVTKSFENSQDNHLGDYQSISGDITGGVTFSNLVGDKDYYIYARIRAFGEFDETTAWYEAKQYLPAEINVSMPKKIAFFGAKMIKSDDDLVFQNHGNVPVDVKFELTDKSDKVKLVSEVGAKNSNELRLNLMSDDFNWNFANLSNSDSLRLAPFVKSGNQKNLSLSGEYSGPIIPTKTVDYKLKVTLKQVKGGE